MQWIGLAVILALSLSVAPVVADAIQRSAP